MNQEMIAELQDLQNKFSAKIAMRKHTLQF